MGRVVPTGGGPGACRCRPRPRPRRMGGRTAVVRCGVPRPLGNRAQRDAERGRRLAPDFGPHRKCSLPGQGDVPHAQFPPALVIPEIVSGVGGEPQPADGVRHWHVGRPECRHRSLQAHCSAIVPVGDHRCQAIKQQILGPISGGWSGTRSPRHHLGQPVIGLRAQHDVDVRRARQDLGTLRLGDAAGDSQNHPAAICRGTCRPTNSARKNLSPSGPMT